MHAIVTFLLALAIALPLPTLAVPTPEEVDEAHLQWWPAGVTQVGQGFHIRVPVTVRNPHTYAAREALVLAEVDIAEKLAEAGWISRETAGRAVLSSFELDLESVRVVAMTNLFSGGGGAGSLRAYDLGLPASDPRRYEVPSTYFQGFLSSGNHDPFDAKGNPQITVTWQVDGVLEPGEERSFVIYFDSLTNNDHQAPDYRTARGGPLLDRAFGPGPATDLIGIVRANPGQAGTVMVMGLHKDTEVRVLIANENGAFEPAPVTSAQPAVIPIGFQEYRNVFVSNAPGTLFRLIATKPVLAQVDAEGFVPSTKGEIAGNDFAFATRYPANVGQNSIFIVNHNKNTPPTPTVVQLQNIDAGTTVNVALSGPGNQFPYTLGTSWTPPRAGANGCFFPATTEAPALPTQPQRFRATVTSGGPVSIQFQPMAGITPIPAASGEGRGTEFWSALSRTSTVGQNNCPQIVAQYSIYAASPTESRLEVYSPETPSRVFPACTANPCPPRAFGPSPASTIDGITINTPSLNDRPLNIRPAAPSWLFVNANPTGGPLAAPMRGPLLGAQTGTSFAGLGQTWIYTPFEDTVVRASVNYASSGLIEQNMVMLSGQAKGLPERGSADTIGWYRLESNRPILVLPRALPPGFMAGIPTILEATLHDADFRGRLVDIRSPTGLDPVSVTTVPSKPANFTLLVTNRGHGAAGANLADPIELSVSVPRPGWSASLSPSSAFTLQSGETREVRLSVTPPSDAEPNDQEFVLVRAQSTNRKVSDSVGTVTIVKSSFGVGLWFDARGGPQTKENFTAAGVPADYTLILQNLGTVEDIFRLEHTPAIGAWAAALTRNGEPVSEVKLGPFGTPQDSTVLKLRITPPNTAGEDVLFTTVRAKSISSPSTVARADAITELQAPSHLVLEVDNDTKFTNPNQEVVFNLTLTNDGDGSDEVEFELRHDRRPGWTTPILFLRDGAAQRTIISNISVLPGGVVPLSIAIKPDASSYAGNTTSIRFQALGEKGESSVEDIVYSIVRLVHNVSAEKPAAALQVRTGAETLTFSVRLTNRGNVVETLRPSPGSLPPGWNLTFGASHVLLPRGASQMMTVKLRAPAAVAEATYPVALRFVTTDGNVTLLPLQVRVSGFSAHQVDPLLPREGTPGQESKFEFRFNNRGNTPLFGDVEAADDEPWGVSVPTETIVVPPGATVTIPIAWRVPVDAPDGTTSRKANLLVRPDGGASETVSLEAKVVVGRADLTIARATGFEGPAGRILHVEVQNTGSRPAQNVLVEVRLGNETLDALLLDEVASNTTRSLSFLQPDAKRGTVTIVVDPANEVPETTEDDNSRTVPDAALTSFEKSPIGSFAALIALATATLIRRRTP